MGAGRQRRSVQGAACQTSGTRLEAKEERKGSIIESSRVGLVKGDKDLGAVAAGVELHVHEALRVDGQGAWSGGRGGGEGGGGREGLVRQLGAAWQLRGSSDARLRGAPCTRRNQGPLKGGAPGGMSCTIILLEPRGTRPPAAGGAGRAGWLNLSCAGAGQAGGRWRAGLDASEGRFQRAREAQGAHP